MKQSIRRIFSKIGNAFGDSFLERLNELHYAHIPFILNQAINKIYESPRYKEDGRLLRFGFKVFSQNDEDGIIREIFRRIGTTNKYFVEIGVGNGLENNSLFLILDGWKGIWVDGDRTNCNFIKNKFNFLVDTNILTIRDNFVDDSNINEIFIESLVLKEIDLLSIDIDGNDYHIFKALNATSPRVVVIEYNAKFPPPILWVMKYNPKHVWNGTDYCGASLKSYERLFANRGYSLVGCNITGGNAFFVRNDLIDDNFCQPFTAENHYEPPRYWLTLGFVPKLRPDFGEFESF